MGTDGVVIQELDGGTQSLRLAVDLPGLTQADLWRAWTDPARLAAWWPPVAKVDLRVAGSYRFSWPAMGWHLRGVYQVIKAPRLLKFTWRWDHEPAMPERVVTVELVPLAAGGTRVVVTHGSYGDGPVEAEERAGHLAGWKQFIPRLATMP
ncbi:MAG: SRPBCC domain-containing protein [Candidatus Limnocylindrales bacterium]